MDFQFWFYVIIAVIIFVSRVLKKKDSSQEPAKPERTSREPYRTENPVPKAKPLTFEELLKEITEAKEPQKPVYQPQSRQEVVVDYDDEIEDEVKVAERNRVDYSKKRRVYEEYEESKRQAFVRPSLEETMNIGDTDMKFGKFKEFEQAGQKNLFEEYLKDFQDPEGLKKAVVMAEILNRKF